MCFVMLYHIQLAGSCFMAGSLGLWFSCGLLCKEVFTFLFPSPNGRPEAKRLYARQGDSVPRQPARGPLPTWQQHQRAAALHAPHALRGEQEGEAHASLVNWKATSVPTEVDACRQCWPSPTFSFSFFLLLLYVLLNRKGHKNYIVEEVTMLLWWNITTLWSNETFYRISKYVWAWEGYSY